MRRRRRQHLVDDQDLGLQVRGHGEGQPHIHPRGIPLHRRIQELLDLGEHDDLVEFAVDLGLLHAQDRAVEVHVLATGQLGMESRPDLQEATRPRRRITPAVGSVIRLRTFSKVDFPGRCGR